jgi:hypothetical protein
LFSRMLLSNSRTGPRRSDRNRTASAEPHSDSGHTDPIPECSGIVTETIPQKPIQFTLNCPTCCAATTRTTRVAGTAQICCVVSQSRNCERRLDVSKTDCCWLLRWTLSCDSESGTSVRAVFSPQNCTPQSPFANLAATDF